MQPKWFRASDGTVMPIWFKAPQDVVDFTLDWSLRLAEDDYIINVRHTIDLPGLQLLSENPSNHTNSTGWFYEGVHGGLYEIDVFATTFEGRQMTFPFRVLVMDK